MPKVFISYSSKDQEFVDRLNSDLKKNGIQTWVYKSEIKIGEDIPSRISEGIAESDFILVVFSRNFLNSEWCKKEIYSAITKEVKLAKRVVLPLKIDDCELPEILQPKRYADFTDWPNAGEYTAAFSDLLRAIDPEIEASSGAVIADAEQTQPIETSSAVQSGFSEMERIRKAPGFVLHDHLRQKWQHIETEWIKDYRSNRADPTKQMYLFERLKKLLEPVVGYGCAFISGQDLEALESCLEVFQVLKDLPEKALIDGQFIESIWRQPRDGMMLLFYAWSFFAYTFGDFKTMRAVFSETIVDTDSDERGISYPLLMDHATRHMQAFGTWPSKSFDFVVQWAQADDLLMGRCGEKEAVLNCLLQVDFLASVYFSLLRTSEGAPRIETEYYPNYRRFYPQRYSQTLRDIYHQNRRGKAVLQDLLGVDYEFFKLRWPECAEYLNSKYIDSVSSHTLDKEYFSK